MNAIPPCPDQMPRCLDAVHDAICTQPQNRMVGLTVAQWWEIFGWLEGRGIFTVSRAPNATFR